MILRSHRYFDSVTFGLIRLARWTPFLLANRKLLRNLTSSCSLDNYALPSSLLCNFFLFRVLDFHSFQEDVYLYLLVLQIFFLIPVKWRNWYLSSLLTLFSFTGVYFPFSVSDFVIFCITLDIFVHVPRFSLMTGYITVFYSCINFRFNILSPMAF